MSTATTEPRSDAVAAGDATSGLTGLTRAKNVEDWFRDQRGIVSATLDHFGITTDEEGKTRYPYPNAVKIRPKQHESFRYWEPKLGSGQIELFGHTQPERKTYFLVEGESDAMRLWQELEQAGLTETHGVYGLSGARTWRHDFVPHFDGAETVYVVLDNDDPYKNKQAVDSVNEAWAEIRRDLGDRARRVRLPPGPKDVCEFFDAYDMEGFKLLLGQATSEPVWPPVRPRKVHAVTTRELTELKPEPMDWIVEPILAAGAITMLTGLMKAAGKSTFGKDLATAIACGEDFLGWPTQQGSVIYVTEESPDVFMHSLQESHPRLLETDNVIPIFQTDLFGLTWEETVEEAVFEAYARGAKLVIFDTLMDLAGVSDENSSAEAQRVMPLLKRAQGAGLSVLLLVHSPKAQDLPIETSFRGHGSWFGAVDQGLALRPGPADNLRKLEALGRLSRGRDEWELAWTPRMGWSLSQARRVEYQRSAQQAIIRLLRDAPGQQLPRTKLGDELKARNIYEETFAAALQAGITAGWFFSWQAEKGEKNPETGVGYKGGNVRLVKLLDGAPEPGEDGEHGEPF